MESKKLKLIVNNTNQIKIEDKSESSESDDNTETQSLD